jgi:hypothetical protein
MMMRLFRPCIALALAALVGFPALWRPENAAAESFRQRRKRAEAVVQGVQTFQPPSADSLTLYCEPIRQEAIRLAQKPRLVRWAYEPRRLWLIRRHIDCNSRLMDQEYTYLKHVDIQQAPHLPALKLDEDPRQGKSDSDDPHGPAPTAQEKAGDANSR